MFSLPDFNPDEINWQQLSDELNQLVCPTHNVKIVTKVVDNSIDIISEQCCEEIEQTVIEIYGNHIAKYINDKESHHLKQFGL